MERNGLLTNRENLEPSGQSDHTFSEALVLCREKACIITV